MEKAGLNEEQWGSRKSRMALDPAMNNMMTFEYGRYMRVVIAMFAADLTACFDRMFPSLSNIAAGKFGTDTNVLKSRGATIYQMRRADEQLELDMEYQKRPMGTKKENLR